MNFKRRAARKKEKINKRVDKMLYKEELIQKHLELVQELFEDEDLKGDPKKLNQVLNYRWSEYLKMRIEELEKVSKDEMMLFRSQIVAATTKINNSAG